MSFKDDDLDDFDIIDENELKESINKSLYTHQDQLQEDKETSNYNVWVDEEQNRLLRIHKLPSTSERSSLFKEVVRKGIYNPFRSQIYFYLSGGQQALDALGNVWDDILKEKW